MRIRLDQGEKGKTAPQSVDRDKSVIRGASLITKGPALGHGFEIDDTTLDQIVELAAAKKNGLKSHFGHRDFFNRTPAKGLGRVSGIVRDGDRVRGDLAFSAASTKAPGLGDLADYVMTSAEEDPAGFGMSLIMEGAIFEEPGKRPVFRVVDVLAADVVDDPAANSEGLFERGAQAPSDGGSMAADSKVLETRLAEMEAKHQALEMQLKARDAELARVTQEKREQVRLRGLLSARAAFDAALRAGRVFPSQKAVILGEYEGDAPVCDEAGTPKNLGWAITDPAGFAAFVAATPQLHSLPVEGGSGVQIAPTTGTNVAAASYQALVDEKMEELLSKQQLDRPTAAERARSWVRANKPEAYRAYIAERRQVRNSEVH